MAQPPDSRLARRVLPSPLYRALVHVFEQGISGCMLVGGTALSGYYAGHRRSDDLDLFAADGDAHRALVLAVRSLDPLGAGIIENQSTAQFYSAACRLDGHDFTVQAVLDSNLFRIGSAQRANDGVSVADLDTLLRQKAVTLVSRCAEKDLYDLWWLLDGRPEMTLSTLIELGAEVDSGLTAEAALACLAGTESRESACDFSLSRSRAEVFAAIASLKRDLERGFARLARGQPAPPIGELIKALKPRTGGRRK